MTTAVITGASSGLGAAIFRRFDQKLGHAIDWSLKTDVDITDPVSIQKAVNNLENKTVEYLINCAGVNFIEFIPKMPLEEWDRVMNVNARGIFLTSQALLPFMHGGTILNIVSNASHMPMTSSIAYNASKGAAEIMTKQMSRELIKTHNITVFSISPNKLKNTGMSEYIDKRVQELRGWTAEQARTYQLSTLPTGEETDPEVLAEFIIFLLSSKERHKYLAGCDIPYGL